MLPTPHISVILGNLQYDSHIAAMQVSRAILPAINQARLLFPKAAAIEASPNDAAQVTIDAGEGPTVVLTGSVQGVEHRPSQTIVTLTDGGYELSRYRPGVTFEQQNSANIAEALASDLNISVGETAVDLTIPLYAAHQRRTAAEHIAYRASLSDGYAMLNGENALMMKNWSEGPADIAIKYGRDLADFRFSRQRPLPAAATIGNGPAGSADAPEAMRPDSSQLPESIPEPGPDVIWKPQLLLRTPSAVQTAQNGLSRERNQRAGEAVMAGLLRPEFEPGIKLEIQDIPASGVGDAWVLTHVVHEIAQHAFAHTHMHAHEAAGAGGLLDTLIGAVGGL